MKRETKKQDVWYNLDNAANIYPAISDDRNTNVFRISCELKESVDRSLLQQAVQAAMRDFAYFRVIMRRGLFWFYLERSEQEPQVAFEAKRPCGRLFYISRKDLLFSITYYRNRINLEVFHSVSDGAGALQLLRTVVYHYLALAYREELPERLPALDFLSPPAHRTEDGFSHHYNPDMKRMPKQRRAYTIGGTTLPENSIRVISGEVSTAKILALAKAKGVSVTVYLAALMLCAIYREIMPTRARRRPIGATIPVDLRKHFPSETARNFFGVTDVSYLFEKAPDDFDSVLQSVSKELATKLEPDALAGRMNYTMSVQTNIFARAVPLILKNLVLRAAYSNSERATSCVLSNIGRITMPQPFNQYIERFTCLLNPTPIHRIKLCVCSFEDRFVINFTSCIAETKVEKYFFRHLARNGLDVRITSNGVDDDEIL